MGYERFAIEIQDHDIPSDKKRNNRKCVWTFLSVLLFVCITAFIVFRFVGCDNSKRKHVSPITGATYGEIIFEDDFDIFNLSVWNHEISAFGGGNWEFEYYTNNRSNSYAKDSTLYIKPTLTNDTFTDPSYLTSGTLNLWGTSPADACTTNFDYGCERIGSASNIINPVQSARIRTVNSFSMKYGKIEVRVQLPIGDWIWPAVWLVPKNNHYGDWPASGEIDIIEARCNNDLQDVSDSNAQIGVNQYTTTLHWGPYFGADQYLMSHDAYSMANNGKLSDGFHNFTLEWTPDGFTSSIDDNVMFQLSTPTNGYWDYGQFDTLFPNSINPWNQGNGGTDAPFDQEFYIIFNVAVGGTNGYFPDGSISTDQYGNQYAKPWSDTSQTAFTDFWNARNNWLPSWDRFTNNGENAAMKIDYIRVYEYLSD